MVSVYGRQYDIRNVSEILVDGKYEKYKPCMDSTSWSDVLNCSNGIKIYLSPKVVKLLEEKPVVMRRNIFNRSTKTYLSNGDEPSRIVFPTYEAKEEYKMQFANFLGKVVAGKQMCDDEYGELIPIMFEYFYLLETSDDPDREFELRNLFRNIKPAKKFLKQQNSYHGETGGNMTKYENMVLNTMQGLSSFDVALQLVEMMKYDKDRALGIIDDIILQKGLPCDVLADNDIYSFGYKSLRMTIDDRKR